ncbi:enhancer of mRNA-decapping protein 4 isoform X2 [Bombyx mori]|uniref:Enhancer of mRNA-decapping protein 4 C-terminal domain-containing protein n=1 Tax=Bombyx mori TaxID=7091 RepID=A0A8R2LUG9_BOMMO|nr:enhancer of mRNA-decapping protein 4 isoform X2 [Bombyx mori]
MSLSKYQNLKKSKSLCSLQNDGNNERLRVHRTSESSVELYVMMSDSDDAVEEDMFLEQCRLLTTLKEEIRNSKATIKKAENAHNQVFSELMKNVFSQRIKDLDKADASSMKDQSINVRAKTLLDAIESKRGISMDREISNALVNFLQSEELKEQMVRATAESVKEVIGSCVSSDCSTLYLPVLERSHRRLVRHITKVIEEAFIELEENSASLSKSVYKTSKVLRRALERHQSIVEAASDPEKNLISTLQCSVEEFLHKELKQWRQKVLDMFNAQILPTDDIVELATPEDYVNKVTSPPQPADPEHSIIDQLMKSAEIKKQMNDGDVNGSFERALSAADLSLVMAACRAAEPLHVFTPPCQLRQPVLLSLVQQLATDMVHDTILKCRYIEDAITNLNTAHPDTRAYLPLVVGEVRRHLTKFLSSFPNHVASRRVALIVMAADNLLK